MKLSIKPVISRMLCTGMIILVAFAYMPAGESYAASKPAKPKVYVSVTSNTVTLSWKKAKGAKKYQVYRAASKNGKYKKIKTTKKRSYKNTGLTSGKMYFYKVRSVSGKKRSKFTRVAAAPLAKPDCRPSSMMGQNRIRTMSVKGASGYAVYRSTSKSSGYRYLGSTKGLYYDDRSAKVGTTYYYKIRAYKSASGYTSYSSYSIVRRASRLLAMPKISKQELVVNPDDETKNAIKVTWASVAGAKGYELYRSGDEGMTYTRIYRGSALTYTDKNIAENDAKALKDGTTYYYKVRAYNTVFGGVEAYSYSSPSKHSRTKLLNQAKSWLGYDEKNKKFKKIIDVYLRYKPLPRDVTPAYKEPWCTTYVTASAIKSGMVDIMPRERICRYMIDLYKELGGWVEKDSYKPKPGDLILFDWEDKGKGDCTGAPNHIGIVVSVSGNKIKDIEGNNNDIKGHPVSYRTVKVNGRYIRGFMTPAFDVDNGIVFVLDRVPVGAAEAEEELKEEPVTEKITETIEEPTTEETTTEEAIEGTEEPITEEVTEIEQ